MKRALAAAMSVAILLCLTPTPGLAAAPAPAPQSQQFTDIDGNWAEGTILAFLNAGVLTVPPDGQFHPGDPVTRLDFAVWLAKAAELKPPSSPQPFADEADIPTADQPYVDAARAAGFVSGYPGNLFEPSAPMPRIQMAVVFGRALQKDGATPFPRIFQVFLDGDQVPAWAQSDASVTIRQQVMYGEPSSPEPSVDPEGLTTRAEALTLIERYQTAAQKLQPLAPKPPQAPPPSALAAAYYVNDDWGYNELQSVGSQINALVYTGWSLSYAGQAAGYDSPRTFAWAQAHHTTLLAMFGVTDAQVVDEIVGSPTTVAAAANAMSQTASKYDGAVIDLEGAAGRLQSNFTSLVCQTAALLHAQHKVLWVAVPAETADVNATLFPDDNWVGAYNYAAIAACADLLSPMAYDEHWSGGSPGAIAGAPWVKQVADYAAQQAGHAKVLLGIPGYGYDWRSDQHYATALLESGALNLAAGSGVTPAWDPVEGEAHYAFTDTSGVTHTVWYPTAQSAGVLTAIATQDRLAGVIVWRLGLELPDTWAQIHSALGH